MSEEDILEPRQLCLELISSIRLLEARIDELSGVLGDPTTVVYERRIGILSRLDSLIDTRLKLYESLEIALERSRDGSELNPFRDIEFRYEELQEHVHRLLEEYAKRKDGTFIEKDKIMSSIEKKLLGCLGLSFVGLVVVSALWGFSVHEVNTLRASQPIENASASPFCDYPPRTDCKGYIEEAEKWIKSYEKAEDSYLQCNLDLARCQNEKNTDCICIDPDCQ